MPKRSAMIGVLVAVVLVALSGSASAQSVDPRFRADIERLLEVTKAAALGAQIATIASNNMIDAMRKAQPDVPDRAVAIVKEVLSAEFERAFSGPNGILAAIVDLYAKHFTHEEVTALLEFYNSPAGRKAIAVMPTLAQESAAAGNAWAMANMPGIASKVEQRLRAEGLIK
ncbi:MAG TPA: DUF2059 domain-containing protein [Vicinamibacterales bacterium]|nr:DUF2059 domain-containing protein [Vicinamibacterales bacterium]